MLVAVIGVSQGCGRLTVLALARRGMQVRALARTPSKARTALESDLNDTEKALITYESLDVTTDADTIAKALSGCNAVIFAASGSHKVPFGLGVNHPQSPKFVDYKGVEKVAEACVKTNVKRMVLLSAFDADRGLLWANFLLNTLMSNVIAFKAKGEESLRSIFKEANEKVNNASDRFTYAIVRPGSLRNREPVGPGMIKVGGRISGRIGISRRDVAEVCAECAVSDVPKDCTFDCTQHMRKPQDGFWVEGDKRTPVAESWKQLMETTSSWESMMEKRSDTEDKSETTKT